MFTSILKSWKITILSIGFMARYNLERHVEQMKTLLAHKQLHGHSKPHLERHLISIKLEPDVQIWCTQPTWKNARFKVIKHPHPNTHIKSLTALYSLSREVFSHCCYPNWHFPQLFLHQILSMPTSFLSTVSCLKVWRLLLWYFLNW